MPKGFNMKSLLNDASKSVAAETAEKPPADPSGFDIVNIPYDKIKPSKQNIYGLRDIEELAATIDEMGLLHNLVVKEADEAGFYELTSGERRYRAIGLLKWATVPCKVEKRENEAIDELKLIFANSTARELTEYEKTTQAGRIKELLQGLKAGGHKFKGRMRDIVAEFLKVSSAQVGRYESINNHLSPDWKKEFEAENISITAAYEISTATPKEQAAAFENYKEKGTLEVSRPPETKKEPTAQTIKQEKPPDPPKNDDPKRAYVFLTDTDGGQYEASGSLAVIAAIDGEDFGGYISEGKAAKVDIIMLATALVGEFVQRIGEDAESKNALKANLAALFDGVGGVITNNRGLNNG
ncbi:MAG: ParB/RepB/Spo0J family partition protein [Defluviitaleaceae bacterium]|nr:ParB/RepB/Spo0J family partition protein [Defluviitaleaceae bacterium]